MGISDSGAACRRRKRGWFLPALLAGAVLVGVFAAPSFGLGRAPGPGSAPAPSGPEQGPAETVLSTEQLAAELSRARQSLQTAETTLAKTQPEQIGATAEEVQKKLRLLNTRVLLYGQLIENERKLEEIRRGARELAAKAEGWSGFPDPPPYPLSLVDELRDDIHAEELAAAKEEFLLAIVQEGSGEAREELERAEPRQRQAEDKLRGSLNDGQKLRWEWLLALAQLEVEVARTRILFASRQMAWIEAALALHTAKVEFLRRKLAVASASAPFTREELDQRLAQIDRKEEAVQKVLVRATLEDERSRAQLEQARLALEQASEEAPSEGDERQSRRLAKLRSTLETRKAAAETSALQVEMLKIETFVLNLEELLWEDRYRLVNNPDPGELQKTAQTLEKELVKLREYGAYVETTLKLAQKLAINERQRLVEGALTAEERTEARERLDSYEQRGGFLTDSLAALDNLVRVTARYQEEVAERHKQLGFGERLAGQFSHLRRWAAFVWNYEIFAIEDTIIVNGQPVSGRLPVTVSKIARALLILLLGLWFTSLLHPRVGALCMRLFALEQGAALLLERIFKVVAVFSVILFALISARIPLTVFAFMGGALAIGIGFGAQNLINNFISGIIMLFERPIKVGDQVEIEGHRGVVTSIGARCSTVRRFDGVEILVPNSEFLQKNVVNWTLSDQVVRRSVQVGVAYGSPTREVSRLISSALEEHGKVLDDPAPVVLFEDFADSALVFTAYFWIDLGAGGDSRVVESDIRHMLDRRFRDGGITIAFPQLDVHLEPPKAEPKGNGNGAKNGGSAATCC